MKIGIVTFQETNNYGAILQNYALQKAIHKLGHEAETIDYSSDYIGKPYRLSQLKNKGILTWTFGVGGYLIYSFRTKKNNKFRQHIQFSKKVNKNTVKKIEHDYDIFITGSDQVFNYKLTGFDDFYLLGFVSEKQKCNSFSASLGLSEIPEEYRDFYKNNLQDINVLSVREESAREALLKIVNREINTVLDPCFLLSRGEWDEVAVNPKDEDYVLVYQLGFSKDIVVKAEEVAKKMQCKLVFVPFPVGKIVGGKWDITAGAGELLGYIKYARYVVTDSFHGTLFSILYRKEFNTKIEGTHSGVGARIHDMLDSLGLLDRLLTDDKTEEQTIDYSDVGRKLGDMVEKSHQVLRKILEV